MSFFNLEKIAHLAANDFLKNPNMMICAYLEFAAAAHLLARSGQLSTATSKLIEEVRPLRDPCYARTHVTQCGLSRRCAHAPAACCRGCPAPSFLSSFLAALLTALRPPPHHSPLTTHH